MFWSCPAFNVEHLPQSRRLSIFRKASVPKSMRFKGTSHVQTALQDAFDNLTPGSLQIVRSSILTTLWAGYGRIIEVEAVDGELTMHHLIVKEVTPPPNEAGVGHERKLRSYQVETSFYHHLAPKLRQRLICKLPYSLLAHSNLFSKEGAHGGTMLIILSDLRRQYPRSCVSLDLIHTKSVLRWLAAFHAAFWEEHIFADVWPEGSYWHLDTRREELQCIGSEWAELRQVAEEIDAQLRGRENKSDTSTGQFRTLIHGDSKAANILFGPVKTGDEPPECALYDFQYCGGGYGVKDVVYLLVSSVDARVLQKEEQSLLVYYYEYLVKELKPEQRTAYTLDIMKQHYQLALLDYVRFMAGWGFWGNSSWAKKEAKKYLNEVKLN